MENIFLDIFLRDVFREVFKENGLLYEFFVNRVKKKKTNFEQQHLILPL